MTAGGYFLLGVLVLLKLIPTGIGLADCEAFVATSASIRLLFIRILFIRPEVRNSSETLAPHCTEPRLLAPHCTELLGEVFLI
jgi:hypothetical protein